MTADVRIRIPAPPELAEGSARAWAASIAAHGAFAVLAFALMGRAVLAPPAPDRRIVYVEPMKPPPPPAPAAQAPEAKPPKPRPIVPPKRLIAPPKIDARPEAVAVPEASPPLAVEAGEDGGVAGGRVGGTPGGRVDVAIPAAEVAHPPVPVSRVTPEYPMSARARGIEGLVVLRAIVGRDGAVEDGITVQQSIPALDPFAVRALARWRFEPGRDRDGNAVRVIVDVPIRFQLR